MFKKISSLEDNTFNFVKAILMIFLLFLTPLTIFLMGFGWYDSIQVHIIHSTKITSDSKFFTTSLIFGAIALIASLIVLFGFLVVDFYLSSMLEVWKKVVFFINIIIYSLLFFSFETFSIIFIGYYFSVELLMVILLLPLIYSSLFLIALLNHYRFSKNKTTIIIKKIHVDEETLQNTESLLTIC